MWGATPSDIGPGSTLTPVFGTSAANATQQFGSTHIASAISIPILLLFASNASTNLKSFGKYPPKSTCIRPGTSSFAFAFL